MKKVKILEFFIGKLFSSNIPLQKWVSNFCLNLLPLMDRDHRGRTVTPYLQPQIKMDNIF